jgi:hypothetical protein
VRFRRAPRIAFAALLVELILIAVLGNQGVSPWISKKLSDAPTGDFLRSALISMNWRYELPDGGGVEFVARYVGIGVLLIVLYLLVLAAARGVNPHRPAIAVFFGVWASAVAAAFLGGVARGAYVYIGEVDSNSFSIGHLFDVVLTYGQVTILHGFVLGIAVALIAALVAAGTRVSTEPVAPPVPVYGVPIAEGSPYGAPPVPAPTEQAPPWESQPQQPVEQIPPPLAPPAQPVMYAQQPLPTSPPAGQTVHSGYGSVPPPPPAMGAQSSGGSQPAGLWTPESGQPQPLVRPVDPA